MYKWKRQSKWQRKRFLVAKKINDQSGNNEGSSTLLLANVILDMVNVKLKLFEIMGNNVNEVLVQKMTYYNTYGIEILEQMAPEGTELKIQQLFLLAQFHAKFFSSDKTIQREHTNEAIRLYEKILQFNDHDDISEMSKQMQLKSRDAMDLLQRQIKMM